LISIDPIKELVEEMLNRVEMNLFLGIN
jgi:hypothetical protein